MSFRLFGIRFSMSLPLVCIMTAVVLLDTTLSVTVCFIAAIMHELGHLSAIRHFGSKPEEIRLTLFDIAIRENGSGLRRDKAQLVIVLAGVFVNFLFAAVSYVIYRLSGADIFMLFTQAHLTLGVFNSLPVDSLDGGQALCIILSRRLCEKSVRRVMDIVSLIILLPTACAGFYLLLCSVYNFTLLLTSLYLAALLLFRKRS